MDNTVRKMIMVMLAAALVIIIAGFIASTYYPHILPLPFAAGVLLTTTLNIIKALWLKHVIEKIVAMEDEAAAGNYLRAQYFLRFILTGVVLTIAALAPESLISLWGAVAGIFTFHFGKYSLNLISKADDKDMAEK